MKAKKLLILLSALFVLASCDPITNGSSTDPSDTTTDTSPTDPTDTSTDPDDDVEGIIIPDDIIIHYHRDDGAYANLRFWIWAGGKPGVELAPDGIDDFGMHITLHPKADFPRHTTFYFIIKVQATWSGQSTDTEIQYEDYPPTKVGEKYVLEVWSIPGSGGMIEVYPQRSDAEGDRIYEAYLNSDWMSIHVDTVGLSAPVVTNYVLYGFTKYYFDYDKILQPTIREDFRIVIGSPGTDSFDIQLPSVAQPHINYYVEATFASNPSKPRGRNVSFEKIYETHLFKTQFTYDGDDLGANYTPEYTEFKIWAPTATKVLLKLYYTGTPSTIYEDPKPQADWYEGYDMTMMAQGVYYAKVMGDLHGRYYNYVVTNSAGANEVVDPYAKSAGINGMRGQIVNFDHKDVTPDGWDDIPDVWDGDPIYDIERPTDLTVYEVHVRDLTIDETWGGTPEYAGKYKGFIERGTTYTEDGVTVKTGFDHIEELGVNAVQILPFFDNDNDEIDPEFNWGYNPINYNVVEGGYSLDPYDGLLRVKELREVVHAFATNENKTRVIMDVVYNHVASVAGSNLTKIMPKYYFRTNKDGSYTNDSGVGNDTKSEAPMMSKLIIDSVLFWAKAYKIKGYRFDLMGLIDNETMREVKDQLYYHDPDFVTFGEGWAGGVGSPPSRANTQSVYSKLYPSNESPGILGGFNDAGRNAIRGGNDQGWGGPPLPGYGFMQEATSNDWQKNVIENMLIGRHGTDNDLVGANPYQTVNYASCHDNYTLFDQLNYTLGHGTTEPNIYDVAAASVGTNSAILMSQGIAFLHGGEEIFRTKTVITVAENDLLPEVDRYIPYDPTNPQKKHHEMVEMYGKLVSYNSYKSDDRTNSFKYDRKVLLLDYFNAYKNMVDARKYIPKYEYFEDPEMFANTFSTWTSGNMIGMWVKGKDQYDDICFFLNGLGKGSIAFNDYETATLRYDSLSWYSARFTYSSGHINFQQNHLALLFTL